MLKTRFLKLGLVSEPKWSLGNRGYKASKSYEIGVIETQKPGFVYKSQFHFNLNETPV